MIPLTKVNSGHSTLLPDTNTLIKRLDAINQLRIERALAVREPIWQRIYSELPLLFHYHHPAIPGYIKDDVPHGICSYEVTAQQQQSLDHYAAIWGGPVQSSSNVRPAIAALYSMGSSSSVAQTYSSDLDLWICLQPGIKASIVTSLKEKCHLLSAWANNQGVTVSFFIIDELRFRQPANYHSMVYHSANYDDHYATQDLLLLEEFYRTAVRLAGKRMLWYLIPVALEAHYEEGLLSLYKQGIIDKQKWFDLGALGHLSLSGCLSMARLQLYNSRHDPHKAVLKNLLLETYAWEHPQGRLLALDFKERLQRNQVVPFALDSYCMMLERITLYLTAIRNIPRLERVRRYFYLKIYDKALQPTTASSWRQEILHQLTKQWGWNEMHLKKLDHHRLWCLDETPEASYELLNEMLDGYYNLQRFASCRPCTTQASLEEHGWLMNTLSTTIGSLPNASG